MLENLNTIDAIKVIKSKAVTLENDEASKLVKDAEDSESVLSALTEGECLAVLVIAKVGSEVDLDKFPPYVFKKEGVSLGVVERLFC